MAPAPIPADPTVLSSPLNTSNKEPSSTCVSRRFATAVPLSSIQAAFAHQTQYVTPSQPESHSPTSVQQLITNRESQLDNVILHSAQGRTNKSESSINTKILCPLKRNTLNNVAPSLIEEIDLDKENSLFSEVRRSYNRLSLSNRVSKLSNIIFFSSLRIKL